MKHAIIGLLMLWGAVALTFGVAVLLETTATYKQEASDAGT